MNNKLENIQLILVMLFLFLVVTALLYLAYDIIF